MMRFTRLLAVGLLVLLAAPGLWAANALIVHDGTPGIEADALGNLTSHLVAATYTVTPSVGVPGGSLATYKQIWDIRFNNTTPLTPSDVTAYQTFLAGGGSLFLMGENAGFATRNATLQSFVTTMGGGTVTLSTPANTQTVNPPFNVFPPVSTITFLAADGITFPPGTGYFITRDPSNIGAATVWGPGTMSAAPTGTLIEVFDVNFMQAGADANSQALTDNIIHFMNFPQAIGALGAPTLGPWALILLAGILAFAGVRLVGRGL